MEGKALDVLLKCYCNVFSAHDDVCLVIRFLRGASFNEQSALDALRVYQARPQAPEIEYLGNDLNAVEMAGLFSSCQCFVHVRADRGLGLPIIHAMARGLPVLAIGFGVALDLCRGEHAYFIPARIGLSTEKRVGALETTDFPWNADPDQDMLRLLLRQVVENPGQAKEKGAKARQYVKKYFTWEHSVAAVAARLDHMFNQPDVMAARPSSSAPVFSLGCPRVSLTMIVKNEETNLAGCLDSVAGLVGELIIVDTGSTDATVAIAKSRGAKVFHFPWVDDFAAARNEALRHATGDWIFWMDADDRLDVENRLKFQTLLNSLPSEFCGFVMGCLCLPDPDSGTATLVDHVRLFASHPELRWKYRVHEQILAGIRRLDGIVRWSDVVIHHVGYQDADVRERKLERDLRLLHVEDHENPDDPFTLFNLGSVYLEKNELARALELLQRSLRRSDISDSIVRKLYSLLAQTHRLLGDLQAANRICQEGRKHYPQDPEILFQESITLQNIGDHNGAIFCLLEIVSKTDGTYFASVDTGLRGCKAHHNLAVLYLKINQWAEAELHWQRALEKSPNYTPALIGLGDLYLKRARFQEFQEISGRLETNPQGKKDGELLNARKFLLFKDFDSARSIVNRLINEAPDFLPARILLSHILLQEDRDWNAAELALKEILTRDPANIEARSNLDVLFTLHGNS